MTRLRAAFAFTAAVLRTLLRDPQALFFMLVLPMVVIIVIGTTFGGQGTIELGVVADPTSVVGTRVLAALDEADGIEVERFTTRDSLASAVRHRTIDAGLAVPANADTALSGSEVALALLTSETDSSTLTIEVAVGGAVDEVAAVLTAATFATERAGPGVATDPGSALEAAERVDTRAFTVEVVDVGAGRTRTLSDFTLVVPQNLVLFTFINATASAAFLVRCRRQGVLRRALASQAGLGTLLVGLTLGWFAVALVQSLIIVVIGRVAFDVDWGDPIAATTLVVLWAFVGCGAGLVVGAFGENEDRVGSIAPVVGIVLGALGGCMVPFEVFPAGMQTVAHAVPHTWALTAWHNVVFDGGGLAAIAGSVAVLAAWAVGLIGLATFVLRRRLTR